jgi:adenylosuccinate lyase
MNSLQAISPVDGRYRNKTGKLENYFSESALIKYRVWVEIEYLIALTKIPLPGVDKLGLETIEQLRGIHRDFSLDDAKKVKDIEKTTNHDVKAVEYFIKEKMKTLGLERYLELVHFGLTSQDINNTAIPLSLNHAMDKELYPLIYELDIKLNGMSKQWKDIPMLARTHGQPASPTKVGKEIAVFIERLDKQLGLLKLIPYSAKFGSATGNFNAHKVAYPNINWVEFANSFVNFVLGLDRSQTTTQIEHYDNMAALFDGIKRINTILIDLCRDMWTYISMDYFKQKIKDNEVGSSTMPHKVNPIDFENAEGNLGVANAIFEHLSAKLPISRLQRDLTDSTVTRNIGVPIAHTIIAIHALMKGLDKLIINTDKINQDLEDNWAVVAEGIQTILRRENYPEPYEALKGLTRTHTKIDKSAIHSFIDSLDVSVQVKEELKQITPYNYTGL